MAVESNTGPVEIAVLQLPGRDLDGEIVPALAELVDDGIVRILDVVVVSKDVDGTVTTAVLADDVVATLADAVSFGCSALPIVWKCCWARRLTDAVAASGGRLVAHDRLAGTARDLLAPVPNT